jgi:hypothetical protein
MIKNQKVPNRSVASLAFRRDKFYWGGFVEHLQRKNHKLLHEPGGTVEMETDPTLFGWEMINSTPAHDLSNVFTWWNHNRDSEYLPQSNSCTNRYNTAHENGSVALPKANDRRSICV